MISIVVPSYNAGLFIGDTLKSILKQNFKDLEIIVVDDGSTDNSVSIIQEMNSPLIKYVYQPNRGVSSARNKGMTLARGQYIIFFDSDDQMSEGFLEKRKECLDCMPDIGFCCGPVSTIPVNTLDAVGVAENVDECLLMYKPQYSSCPSNYLIRRSILEENQLAFNEKLSSTADRFFLLEMAKVAQGKLIDKAPLLYRISPNSMSNKLSRNLILDNEAYFEELQNYGLIPEKLKDTFYFKIQYILGLGFLKTGIYRKGCKYTIRALRNSPRLFFKELSRKLYS